MNPYTKLRQPVRRVLETQNSQRNRRPDFPRWLRRSLNGKNKHKIKTTLARAFRQGIFTPAQYAAAKRTHSAKRTRPGRTPRAA